MTKPDTIKAITEKLAYSKTSNPEEFPQSDYLYCFNNRIARWLCKYPILAYYLMKVFGRKSK